MPGFFNESLPAQPHHGRFAPALYVDLDADLYLSTYQALDWLLERGIVVNGTILGYDDFNQGIEARAPRRGAMAKRHWVEGAARAHREI